MHRFCASDVGQTDGRTDEL